jgi:hypothetical protein
MGSFDERFRLFATTKGKSGFGGDRRSGYCVHPPSDGSECECDDRHRDWYADGQFDGDGTALIARQRTVRC